MLCYVEWKYNFVLLTQIESKIMEEAVKSQVIVICACIKDMVPPHSIAVWVFHIAFNIPWNKFIEIRKDARIC